MLITWLIQLLILCLAIIPFFISGLASVFNINPTVTTLPMGIDSVLVSGIGYLKFLFNIFPPFVPLYYAFLFIIGFKIAMKAVAMIPIVRGLLHK